MNNYKYRGKDKRGKWLYGDLIHEDYIRNKIVEVAIKEKRMISVEVDPKTVGQWTGRLDDYKKEIYAGDVVDGGYKNFKGEYQAFQRRTVEYHTDQTSWNIIGYEKIKVISNIHDNET